MYMATHTHSHTQAYSNMSVRVQLRFCSGEIRLSGYRNDPVVRVLLLADPGPGSVEPVEPASFPTSPFTNSWV